MKKLVYMFSSGKNTKFFYYMKNVSFYLISSLLPKINKKKIDKRFNRYSPSEQEDILKRVNYYCKLPERGVPTPLSGNATTLAEHIYGKVKSPSVYFFDTYIYTAYFNQKLKWEHLFGDIINVPDYPSIVKSRPLCDDNINSVVMKLDKIRHFTYIDDTIPFRKKMDKVIFRGAIAAKSNRIDFMHKFSSHPMVNAGCVDNDDTFPKEWKGELITLREHLKYKFIMALEGNDVASNLKWIMSSNSIAVMPKPTCETWFMEGTLIANYHYIEVAADFSDLEERVNYYISRPELAEEIILNANEYVNQFKNDKKEDLISFMVLQQYFDYTN